MKKFQYECWEWAESQVENILHEHVKLLGAQRDEWEHDKLDMIESKVLEVLTFMENGILKVSEKNRQYNCFWIWQRYESVLRFIEWQFESLIWSHRRLNAQGWYKIDFEITKNLCWYLYSNVYAY